MADTRLIDADALRQIYKKGLPQLASDKYAGERRGIEACITVLEVAPTIDPESLRPVSEWELNPHRLSCEHFLCKKCHHIDCVADKYCGECGSKMKNAGVKPEDLPIPKEKNDG